MSPEEQAKWREPLKNIGQIWVDEMEKKGLPGRKVFEEFAKACNQVVKQ
ncbi:MAG: hypothetical protein K6U04_16245 [Armatimonadetes bacterium]|nr:hypothetical protein [Armatimonadota bacterium]